MKKQFLSLLAASALLFSCVKNKADKCNYQDQNVAAPASEISALKAWIKSSSDSSVAVQHSSGIFYVINNPGTGATASVCSTITVKYTGTLLNGSQFDQNLTGFTYLLGQLILGWQKGIPLVKTGGSITLYIPPSLGYGNQDVRNNSGAVVIPANSNLKFVIDVVAVQ